MLDYKIIGGIVIDGTGKKGVPADIGIKGDIIADIGDLSRLAAHKTIQARGKNVCPGFIDIHSHSDIFLIVEPSAPSKILQGVTTEVIGNCGASAFPLTKLNRLPSDWAAQIRKPEWQNINGYFDALQKANPAVNVVSLIGHNTLRAAIMGYQNRCASENEIKQMEYLLEQSMDNGAKGISTGLVYPPGMFTPLSEIKKLAKIVSKYGGIYASHMRNEGMKICESIKETIEIAKSSGAKIQISHLKTSGKSSWHLLDKVLELIEKARSQGMDVSADRYPYTAGYTDLDILLPHWAAEGDKKTVIARLCNNGIREKIITYIRNSRTDRDWENIVLASIFAPKFRNLRGKKISEIALKLKLHPSEAIVEIIKADKLKTTAFFFGMSESNMKKILAQSWVMIGSDASIRSPSGPLGKDYPHPRAYGAFTKYLRMAINEETVSIEEAIRKMSSLPAVKLGLKDRGILKKNYKADIVVFDPKTVRDTADYTNPHKFAEGICYVFVNGALCVSDGKLAKQRAGKIL